MWNKIFCSYNRSCYQLREETHLWCVGVVCELDSVFVCFLCLFFVFECFWLGFNALYQEVSHASKDPGPMARIFEAGMKEFRRARQNGITGNGGPESSNIVLAPASRAMRAAFQREMDALESSLAFLASAGSVSPYIGLFGTVWGIMNAFRGLADVQQATLASVAPGIAEALVGRN